MELKTLMEIENPTLEDQNKIVECLNKIIKEAETEIATLDAEARERSADRLIGKDFGAAARNEARAAARERIEDAAHARTQILGVIAAEEARIEKEIDDAAWARVRAKLDERRKSMERVETLCEELGEHFNDVLRLGQEAAAESPVKTDYKTMMSQEFSRPEQIAFAVLAKVHEKLGNPLRHATVQVGQIEVFQRRVRDGLGDCLTTLESAILP